MLYRIVVGPAVMYNPGPMPQSEPSVPAGQLMLYVVVPALYVQGNWLAGICRSLPISTNLSHD